MLLISSTSFLFGQSPRVPIKFWELQSIGGLVGIEGEYKTQNIVISSNLSDDLKSSLIEGQFQLQTQSYFYHPNLVVLETEVEYNPGAKKEKYLVIPDRSDNNTGESARGLITFLRTQPVIVRGSANYAHLYTNREYATSIETYNTGLGFGISYRNKFAPININYQKEKVDQKELQTNRRYLTKRQNLRANLDFSLSYYDNSKLTYTLDHNERHYYSSTTVKSKISSIQLNNIVNFDSTKLNTINSNIYYSLNSGNFDYNRLQINENLNLQLEEDISYQGGYHFFNFRQQEIKTIQHNVRNTLQHQLYKSLTTQIHYDYINSSHTFSKEVITEWGAGLSYNKKIPTGVLNLSYDFRKRILVNTNLAASLIIINEEHLLNDADITLLNNPFIDINSIRVKDITGTLLYQINLDYIIIERNNFFEIQRLPGGLIIDGASIYVDYRAIGQQSYEYAVNTNIFTSRLSLLNNLFEVYFRLNENTYDNVPVRDATILRSISQRVYGSKIHVNFLSAGIEFDDYNSHIIPYESTRYFLTFGSRLTSNLNTSLTANLRFIELIDEKVKQKFHDVSGRLVYGISSSTSFNLDASYRFQKGKGLNLDLSVIRGELITQYRSIYLTLGIEG